MMDGYGMGFGGLGMGFGGFGMLIISLLVIVTIAALIKYLMKK